MVDYKLFVPGADHLSAGLLWTSETMPGHGRRADVTAILQKERQWAGYNIPYFRDLFKMSQESLDSTEDPDANSYTRSPRAKMFARVDGEVTTLTRTLDVMRYNGYPGDPLSKNDACNAIASRCDLNPHDSPKYSCFGATNAKTARYRAKTDDLSFFAILSPTHEAHPVFVWSEQNGTVDGCRRPVGMPDRLGFGWWSVPKSLEETPFFGGVGEISSWSGGLLLGTGSCTPGVFVLPVGLGAVLGVSLMGRLKRTTMDPVDHYVEAPDGF